MPAMKASIGRFDGTASRSEQDDLDWVHRGAYWESHTSAKPRRSRPSRNKKPDALLLSGHGVHLRVEHGALLVQNGFTHYPQKRESWRLFPGQRTLPDRIVMLDGTGSLSFDVLSWLSAQRIPLVQINWQGEVITVLGGTPLAADARPLVETQRAAANGETGLALSVTLVREKIRGCKTTLESLPESLPRGGR
jgi:CRISPR-associated protein Cas1